MVGMVFIIGITPLSDIKMLMMCNTVFNNREDIGSNPFVHVKSVHSLNAKNIFIVIFNNVIKIFFMNANNLLLICTCGACPEQYDVITDENELVGYIRFRWGHLYCCPQNQNGIDFENVVYTWDCDDGWAGVIPGDVREEVLENCKQALAKFYTEKQATT